MLVRYREAGRRENGSGQSGVGGTSHCGGATNRLPAMEQSYSPLIGTWQRRTWSKSWHI